jgi:short-subunit dehydrogenase
MAKKAIVMGATSGIGMEVAKLLAAKGWQVGIAGRRIERLQALIPDNKATPQGGIICYQQIDVTSAEAPSQLLELIDKLGGMDLYFHSSGIGWQNNSLDIEKELKTVETNGLGFTRMIDTAFNWFATHHQNNSKARIACITSIAGTKGLGAAPAYSATKRFQNHYLECLSQQARMRHLHISITDIRPGFVKTALIAGSTYPLQLQPEDVAKHIVRAIEKGKEVKVIDWRYAILVFFWRLIPRGLWTRLRITT